MSQKKIHTGKTDQGPWWREPWPWIIMAGPFLAIVGCIITIVLAFQNTGNKVITDGGVKRGLVVTQQEQAPASEPQQ
ncbi:FixH family protein [Pusillimonas sp. MFBS29]|uniref:FixH family protein n=1 Tax=Pusillimonas sp. MFBS29 TaxID=2886690 RepID=UPI001D12BCAE|nr:FixH family protein [Pusillimonas sp. MFBS29]MCC2595298.1 FixH family protein [Pusillimonas sp. MFBS29]